MPINFNFIRYLYNTVLFRKWGKDAFIDSLPPDSNVLDVGCGNNSPMKLKMQRPDLYYIGLDIGDYNQTAPVKYADEYILTRPEHFAAEIRKFEGQLDAVISAHNIEHCSDPDSVMNAMLAALKPGGRIFLSFPCEASVRFPSRRGCLNFYDDGSHDIVPDWGKKISKVCTQGLVIDYSAQRYRPIVPALLGLLLEPVGALTGRQMPIRSTWALYGFESIIWASRPK
jgi:SAM-dependent methyltransferase